MEKPTRGACGGSAWALAALFVSSPLFAQVAPPAPPTNAGQELQNVTSPPAPPRPDADVLPQDGSAPRAANAGGPAVEVKGFDISGNTVFPTESLQGLLKPYVGQRLDGSQLNAVAEAVKNQYRDAGYFLTQVFVPPQTVQDGMVKLVVVEARIGKTVAAVETTRVRQGQIDAYLGLLPPGTPVFDQTIERPLLLINDVRGVKIVSELRPGAEPGDVDLAVTVADRGNLVTGDAYVDDGGNNATGLTRVGADVFASGLLGLGETWSLGGIVSQHDGVNVVRGGLTLPVGGYGTKVSLTGTDLHYKVTGDSFSSLQADGYAYVASVALEQPFTRSRNANLFGLVGVDYKVVNDKLQGGASQNDRHVAVLNLGVTGDYRDSALGGALNTYTAFLYAGDNQIETPAAKAVDDNGHHTGGSFQHVDADYQRLQALGDTTSLLVALRGQLAFDNLDQSEKASLGGPRGVRAYAVGDGAGDDVFQATLELRQAIPSWHVFGAPVIAAAFMDVGHYKTWHDPLDTDTSNSRTLKGVGVGVNITQPDDFQFRLDIATKVGAVDLPGSDKRNTHFWALFQKWF